MRFDRSTLIKASIIIAALIFTFLLGLIIYLTVFNKKQKESGKVQPLTNDSQNDRLIKTIPINSSPSSVYQSLKAFPKVNFDTYKNQAEFPQIPKTLNSYLLKTTFNQNDIANIQAKLGFNKTKLSSNNTILYSETTKEILAINRINGSFIFESLNTDQELNGTAKRYGSYILKDQAGLFLNDIGLDNQTISCPISYNKTGYEGYTFIECHRDWSKVGLPILNPVGLLDIPENVSLQSLALGKVGPYFQNDSTIYNVSDGENFKKRPDDFNTATFIFDANRHLIAAKSNLLFLSKPTSILGNLLSPSEAIKQFMAHKSAYSMASVTGEGAVDPQTAFPSRTADGKLGVITDFILTYLQNPSSSQTELSPMYVIRGYSQLYSGFRSSFVEVIPASKTANFSQVLGVSTQKTQVLGDTTDTIADVTGQDLLSLSCLKNTGSSPGAASTVGGSKTESVRGEGFPVGKSVIILACLKKPAVTMALATDCTTGNSQLDATWGLSSNSEFTFSITGANPITAAADGTIAPFTVSTSTNLIDVGIYFYGAVEKPPTTAPGGDTSQKQGELTFQVLQKDCANIQWNNCKPSSGSPSVDQLTNVIQQSDGSIIGQWKFPGDVPKVWYYVPAPGVQLTENELYNNILAVKKQLTGDNITVTGQLRTQERILNEFRSIGLCPIRITGGSPTLFAYGKEGSKISVTPGFKVVYADTSRDISGSWNIKFEENNLLNINSYSRQYLYYEYDQKKFNVSSVGWYSNRDKISELVQDISNRLQLLPEEKKRLQFEFQQATKNIDSQSGFSVALIPASEVNIKLPLKIDPEPDNLYRLHFLISSDNNLIKSQPTLLPIKRNGLTIIEIGATTQY